MNTPDALPSSSSAAGRIWTISLALCSFPAAGLAGFWLYFAVVCEPGLLLNPTVAGGIGLLLVGAAYGGVELIRRFRRRPPRIPLLLGTLFMVVMQFTGAVLILNGLLARKHPADTRIIEGLRVIDDAGATQKQPPTPDAK